MKRHGIAYEIPDTEDREKIDAHIFSEFVYGRFREETRRYFNEVYQRLKDRGCDAAILGCTEIPLLVDPLDCPLPTLDSTRLLARAAEMRHKGYRSKRVITQTGEIKIRRAYYHCEACGKGLFPLG